MVEKIVGFPKIDDWFWGKGGNNRGEIKKIVNK